MMGNELPSLVDQPVTHGWLGGWLTRGMVGGAIMAGAIAMLVSAWNWGVAKVAKIDKTSSDLDAHKQHTADQFDATNKRIEDGFATMGKQLEAQMGLLSQLVGRDK